MKTLDVYTPSEIREMLLKRIGKFGTQLAYAEHLGVTRSFVNHVLNGRRRPGYVIENDLGFYKIEGYARREK